MCGHEGVLGTWAWLRVSSGVRLDSCRRQRQLPVRDEDGDHCSNHHLRTGIYDMGGKLLGIQSLYFKVFPLIS